MKASCLAGLASLASLGAQAQVAALPVSQATFDPVVVTASRGLSPTATLRDAVVITREDLDAAGPLSLAEVLQRRAGIEVRATGGPGQPQGLFIRGAGSGHTLVLVDGMRVGSATVGTTSIENIPIEMIERIEVVKGPMSSLYGPDAIGGVVQIFTRGKSVPHLFADIGYGTWNDTRGSAGLVAADDTTLVALTAGARKVDAPSATNPRVAFGYNPDRDPYENAFVNLRASQRLWQGETLLFEAFGSRARTHFDAGPGDDRNDQAISGARLSSSTNFTDWWGSRLAVGQGRDRLVVTGNSPNTFETRQDQASWINEIALPAGTLLAGWETVRQRVISDERYTVFATTRRDTNSGFAGLRQAAGGDGFEGSVRQDRDEQFGKRTTGSASYGATWPSVARLTATYGRGFRPPTFYSLYGPTFEGFKPNPDLRPEHNRSSEVSIKNDRNSPLRWRLTGFDNRIEDLIVFSLADSTEKNIARARIRGVEASVEGEWWGTRVRAAYTAQRPRDEDSGKRLQGRAQQFGSLELVRRFGQWTATVGAVASGSRFDSPDESPASRLPGYAVIDARLRYAIGKQWAVEVAAANLGDRRREDVVGYAAPRRAVLLSVKFEAF